MDDLKNEVFICAQCNDALLLSNVRLQYLYPNTYQSIRLEDITYIGYVRRDNPKIIYWTIFIALLIAFFARNSPEANDPVSFVFLLAVIIGMGVLVYYLSIKKYIVFSTSGGQIGVNASGMSEEETFLFIERTEKAIHEVKRRVFAAPVKI